MSELISIPTSDLAKPGYDVSGLYTDADMTQEFTSGVVNAEADMTLYVSYTPKSYYMMVDNGTGDEVRVNVTYGNSYQLTAPIRDGYRFIQYSYMGEELPMNGTYNYTNSIPVVAKWEKIVYINVYDGVSFTKVEVAADGKFELPDVDDTDEKIFAGYLNGASAFGTFDSATGKWVGEYNGKDDVYLTYKWNDVPKYTLTVNGLYGDDAIAPQQYKDGQAYSLPASPTRAGYFFLGYELDGEAFAATGEWSFDESITVTAKWKRQAKITVYNGASIVETVTVSKNGEYALTAGADTDTHRFAGFLLGSEEFAATGTYLGEDDLIVMQNYTLIPTYTLTVNGLYGEDVIAPQSYKTGAVFTLPAAPTRDGYIFAGYTVNGVALTVGADGKVEFIWSNHTTVVANWRKLIYVTIYDGQNTVGAPVEIGEDGSVILPAQSTEDTSKIFNGYNAAGITFTKNQDGTYTATGLTADVSVTVVWYKLPVLSLDTDGGALPAGVGSTVTLTVGANTLPIPTRDNYVFAGWYFGSEIFTSNNGEYTFAIDTWNAGADARLVARWTSKDEVGEVVGKDYFKELDTQSGEIIYVFLTGTDNYYVFEGKTLTLSANDGVVSLNADANGFIANKPGSFNLTIASLDGSTRTVRCRVETRVLSLDSNKRDDESYKENFNNGISDIVDAGVNNIRPDIDGSGVVGNTFVDIMYSNIPVDVLVEEWNGESYQEITEGFTYSNGAITLSNNFVGKQVRVTIVPKYAVNAERENQTVVFEYKLNEGVNVYDSKDLFLAFGNTNITKINILREITAVVDPSQSLNGNPNYPLNQNDYNGIYVRVPTADDSVVINGNCYMIDASAVALFDPLNGGIHRDGYCADYSYYYINVHAGIFTYHADESLNIDANININNLYIHGNFDGKSDATTPVFNDAKPILTGSQTYNGIIIRQAHLTLDNARIDHTNVAIQSWGYDTSGSNPGDPTRLYTSAKLNGVQIDITFAQSIYGWGQVGIETEATYIGQSSGAAIHISDSPILKDNEFTGYLDISSDTVIENYVTGTEPWFVAFNMTDDVGMLKYGLNMALGEAGSVTKDEGGNELFNFMICIDSAGPRFEDLDPTIENEPTSNGPSTAIPYYPVMTDGEEIMANVPSHMVGQSVAGVPVYFLSDINMTPMSIILQLFISQ